MVNVNNLNKYYEEIAGILDSLIPVKWDKVVLLGEEVEELSLIRFYFFTKNLTELHYSGTISDEYGIDETIVDGLTDRLININKMLLVEFIDAGERPWSSLTFHLDSNWRFKAKYGYKNSVQYSSIERDVKWFYDELGLIPESEYEKKLLQKYL